MRLFWHRRDLRAADNRGLAAAADAPESDEAVLPVFVVDDALLEYAGAPRVRFMLDALAGLRDWYRDRGSDLVTVRGDPREAIPDLAAEHEAETVVWNEGYSGMARRRDRTVRDALAPDCTVDTCHDAVLHEPGAITTTEGEPYAVYSYYWKKWKDRAKEAPAEPPDAAALVDREAIESGGELPTLADLGFDEPAAAIPDAGTAAARERLESFCNGDIYRYETDRDYPARNGTSRLSPHLTWGTIGIREVYEATEAARDRADSEDEASSVEEFQSQLAWREFYTQVLAANPSVVAENYKSYENSIEWRDDPEALQAWTEGKTGYPIVDAGMRQLRAEAWMHNRVRMIVASFLTKDLLIDWREGYAHFRERLVDHDTANDNGGWQWAASTGTDAQPYFRIFNPMTQGERYDPDAEYIREYVPELRDVAADEIHAWHELDEETRAEVAPDYPSPIVEHAERREAAIQMFEQARGKE